LLAQKKKKKKERTVIPSPPLADALCCSQKADATECRFARPRRFSAFYSAARLREMAFVVL